MKVNLKSPTLRGVVALTPWERKWYKRMAVMFFFSFVFSQTPILLVSSEMYLIGRWGIFGKLWNRFYGLRKLRLYRRGSPRPNRQ